ncbi:TPA: glycosyltransferase, partial [Klebsiella pneumoniae]|nr:glycosyltransferase [Klebsiella pneumoniae]HBT0330897.1 glycosyltransferase [Klebsiella pneumoniae]
VYTHGMLDPWFKKAYPLKHLKKWLYWPWADYRVLRDAKSVIFTCEEERILARKSFWFYKANEAVTSYGAAQPPAYSPEILSCFNQLFPKLAGQRFFLFLSRIHEKKGCDLLIKAFAKIAHQDPELQLAIAGPDQVGLKARLQALAASLGIENRIHWLGMLSGDAKWGAFHASEVFVLPSHQENFGIVVAEALACSKPVLISNKVNIWREIEADNAGIVANDDLNGTESLFSTWIDMNDEDRQTMSTNAVKCFNKRFTVDAMATSLLSIISQN